MPLEQPVITKVGMVIRVMVVVAMIAYLWYSLPPHHGQTSLTAFRRTPDGPQIGDVTLLNRISHSIYSLNSEIKEYFVVRARIY